MLDGRILSPHFMNHGSAIDLRADAHRSYRLKLIKEVRLERGVSDQGTSTLGMS